jgi:hypothetical protein
MSDFRLLRYRCIFLPELSLPVFFAMRNPLYPEISFMTMIDTNLYNRIICALNRAKYECGSCNCDELDSVLKELNETPLGKFTSDEWKRRNGYGD